GGRRPVPVLLPRREPDHVAGPNLLDRAALALHPAAAGRDDQGLAQWMRVPRRPGTGLEGDAGTGRAGRDAGLEQGVDADRAGEPLGRSLAGRLCTNPFDLHAELLPLCRWINTSPAAHRREGERGDAGELKELAAGHLGLTSFTQTPALLEPEALAVAGIPP